MTCRPFQELFNNAAKVIHSKYYILLLGRLDCQGGSESTLKSLHIGIRELESIVAAKVYSLCL